MIQRLRRQVQYIVSLLMIKRLQICALAVRALKIRISKGDRCSRWCACLQPERSKHIEDCSLPYPTLLRRRARHISTLARTKGTFFFFPYAFVYSKTRLRRPQQDAKAFGCLWTITTTMTPTQHFRCQCSRYLLHLFKCNASFCRTYCYLMSTLTRYNWIPKFIFSSRA